jgi:hypothetical protein
VFTKAARFTAAAFLFKKILKIKDLSSCAIFLAFNA